MKFTRIFLAICLLFTAGIALASEPANPKEVPAIGEPGGHKIVLVDPPELTAYNAIKVGDSAEAVTAILDPLTKGDKNAVTKKPYPNGPEIWSWGALNKPSNWDDKVLPSPVTASKTEFEIAFKEGKVVAVLYSHMTVTKTLATKETVTEKEKELLQTYVDTTSRNGMVKGDKAFLASIGR